MDTVAETGNNSLDMVYLEGEPWRGLGTEVAECKSAADAIRAAGLSWEVEKKPLFAGGKGQVVPVPHKFAVVRSDLWGTERCPVLGIVGKEYTPLQNLKAFEFFDPIVHEGQARYEVAGEVADGRRVWILTRLFRDIQIVEGDTTRKYLLLSNSHDGTSSVQIKFTPIRVWCENMLTMALSQGPTLRISHFKDLPDRLAAAKDTLQVVETRFNGIEKAFQSMCRVQMDDDRLALYLNLVFPDPRDPSNEKAADRVKKDRRMAANFFAHGRGNKEQGIAGSLWAAYNGVAEYIDHRSTSQSAEQRLNSLWFGEGYFVKARAFKIAESKHSEWKA